MAFTKEQQLAIDTEGTNIIVSAGAGSGKTAVLTERVIRKLKQGIDINRLLVLTFTNEAAREMKSRIRDSIIKNELDDQLVLLDSSYITTFDSFALSLVKKYNYLLNVSDNLKIIDSSVITIYKNNLLDEIFENRYGDSNFDRLINDFCLKDDKNIKEFILELSNKLDLLIDKDGYIDNYFLNFYSEEHLNKILKEYLKLIECKIIELTKVYDELKYYLDDKMIIKIDDWLRPLLNANSYMEYTLFLNKDTPRFTKMDEDGIKLKNELKVKITEIKELLRFKDENEILDGITSTKEHIKVILDIVCELNEKTVKYKDMNSVYEFNDISHMAIDIVKDNLEVREELKNYFNEIMVDEYQDTSNIQETFLNYIENNNIYMVGDIKQSIYRFRNANPYIFHDKYVSYSNGNNGIKIDLIKNFRSRKEVLNNINEIFNLIMDDDLGNANYLDSHNMVYGNTLYDEARDDTDYNLEVYNYEVNNDDKFTKEEKELFIISEDILNKIKNKYQVFDKKTGKLRDIKYSDICIITDRNKYLANYKKILEYHGLPSVIYMDESLNTDMITLVMKNLIDLVWHVKNQLYDNKLRYLFASVARSNLFEYTDDKILHLLKDKEYYRDEIISLAKEINIDKPMVEVINNIIDKYHVYEKLLILPNIEKNTMLISNLIDISSSLSHLGYTIGDFVDYISDTIELNIPIKYSSNTSGEDAIKIMNIHKSKGLEFSLCYYTGMYNRFTISDIKSKNLFNEKYGIIIPYMKDDELKNTILRDLYINDYYKEEISEKIRLLYVSLTRCREKMIIMASLDSDSNKYNHLVPYIDRIKYRSFLDILNSIGVIDKYVVTKEGKYTHEYNKIIIKDMINSDSNIVIEKKKVNISYNELSNKHFSKENNKLININKIKDMEYGTKIHEMLEYSDFTCPDNEYVENLLKQLPNDYINTYHEYEFNYDLDDIRYHGIIDLMVEYSDMIYIIDYKLNDITDRAYLKQLEGYQKYIESITDKKVKTYLYSIINNSLMEAKYEE